MVVVAPIVQLSCRIGKVTQKNLCRLRPFGAFADALVFSTMLFQPEWISVAVRKYSIDKKFEVPYRSSIHLPITTAALYALTVLVPLFFFSHRLIIILGGLVALSMLLASEADS